MSVFAKAAVPLLLLSSVLSGCATTSDGSAPLNQRTWPVCSLLGGLAGGGLGSIESSAWAAGGAAFGAIAGGLICYAQDGDEDGDGVYDRRDRCPDTPANTPVSHNGCPLPQYPVSEPAPAPVSDVITLNDEDNVSFAVNSDELTPSATRKLTALMDRLNNPGVTRIKVVGYTDSQGADAYNQRLSERRARSVADFLITQGISADKVTSEGLGESEPIADNATAEGRAQNRRVELHLN
ncbi:OmpA family protein [Pseudomonas akapageensis]|uniref:OmpA family protein n=1 Tax=Pseudomonas akapageensis TaxID=2609961 RepID=UPI00140A8161|nr:OmpA family protein [Pseudomonas akapageensis]